MKVDNFFLFGFVEFIFLLSIGTQRGILMLKTIQKYSIYNIITGYLHTLEESL